MADDLSTARGPVVGVDLVAGTQGRTTRGGVQAPASASPAATGAFGAAVEVAGAGVARLDLVTSVAPGTTYTVTIETSYDNGVTDAYRTVAAFPAQTATGTVRRCFSGLDRWVRANCTTLTGSAPTCTVSGEVV